MARHHYVPQFLLREWATNGYFVAYQYCGSSQESVQKDKTTVASSCQIEDLNAFFGASDPQRNLPETAFFRPRIDTPAARALQVILKRGVRALTPQQRIDWARLLVSFGVRMPDTLHDMGPKEAKKAFDLVESTAKGLPAGEQKVTSIIQQNMPALQHNIPLAVAVNISFDPSKLEVINGMGWWIRRWDKNRLLIGDRPLLAQGLVRHSLHRLVAHFDLMPLPGGLRPRRSKAPRPARPGGGEHAAARVESNMLPRLNSGEFRWIMRSHGTEVLHQF